MLIRKDSQIVCDDCRHHRPLYRTGDSSPGCSHGRIRLLCVACIDRINQEVKEFVQRFAAVTAPPAQDKER